jgi:Na+:H+ antiporter, NhaA family
LEEEMSEQRGILGLPAVAPEDHVRGGDRPEVTLIVYGDYECPYTRKAYRIIERFERKLGERLRLVFRHFPLTEIHPHAQAEA